MAVVPFVCEDCGANGEESTLYQVGTVVGGSLWRCTDRQACMDRIRLDSSFLIDQTIEQSAHQQHEIWARWMRYQFAVSEKRADGTVVIPDDKVDRWERQMGTVYADLSEEEKESDRMIVRDHQLIHVDEDEIGNLSDGYHTFDDLYEHRNLLFLNLMDHHSQRAWIAQADNEGNIMPGWFIAGIDLPHGQISYHIPTKYWNCAAQLFMQHERSPWDGHTSEDVLCRLLLSLTEGRLTLDDDREPVLMEYSELA